VEGLVEQGRSSWYVRDGLFCLYLAAVFAVLQVLVVLPGWAEGVLIPFGVCTIGSAVIGVVQIGVGQSALGGDDVAHLIDVADVDLPG
jgi:hypothetical protein